VGFSVSLLLYYGFVIHVNTPLRIGVWSTVPKLEGSARRRLDAEVAVAAGVEVEQAIGLTE
jgi:hypothetical protein